MRRSIITTVGVFAIAMLLVITGFFLLGIEKIALHYWAVCSLLLSLLVSMLAVLSLIGPNRPRGRVLYTAGFTGAIWVYEIAIVVSMLFVPSFADRVNGFIFLQIAIHALFLIALLVLGTIAKRVTESNTQAQEALQAGQHNKPKRGGF